MSWTKQGFPGGSDSKELACNAGDPGSIPGLGRSPAEGNGNPFQYCDRGEAWSDTTERLNNIMRLVLTLLSSDCTKHSNKKL